MRVAFGIVLLVLAGCAPRGTLTFVPDANVGAIERVYVATTRDANPEPDFKSSGRSTQTHYARFDVSVPPDRELGSLPWPPRGGRPDPRRHFLTTAEARFASDTAFRTDLRAAMAPTRRGAREAVVFVHGFNNTFAEGLYRFAQMTHDLDLPGVPVHYAWPSRGSPLGYAYDRDSALFSRDGLEDLLHEVSEAGADRMLIVAHSMGAHLTMEALRQLALRESSTSLRRVGGVILISPDIDLDVFRAQAAAIGKLPQPFIIFTSARDRALQLSALVAQDSARLGNINDIAALEGLGVTVLEVGAFSKGDGHFTAARSPALIQLLGRVGDIDEVLRTDQRGRVGLLPGAVLTAQGVTKIILSPIAAVGEGLAN